MPNELPTPSVICPACAQGFVCGMVAGAPTCWCFALPHNLPVPAPASEDVSKGDNASGANCFCPACLQQRLNMPTNQSTVQTTALNESDGSS